MKKERIALWVFWVLFLTLVFTWLGAGKFINWCLHQPPRPMLAPQEKTHYIDEANKILNALKEKRKNLTVKDYVLCREKLISIEREVNQYSNAPPTLQRLTMGLSPYFESLRRRMLKEGRSFYFEMSQVEIEVQKELGIEPPVSKVFTAAAIKKIVLWFLKFGFVVFILAPLIYYYRCRERGESLKELILLQPWSFFAYMVFWPVGLGFDYPDGTVGVAWKYHKLRGRYISERGWKYRLSEEEEKMLWQQARGRVDKFDQGVSNAFAYSKALALISSLIIWLISPFQKFSIASEVKENTVITSTLSERGKTQLKKIKNIMECAGLGGLLQLQVEKANLGTKLRINHVQIRAKRGFNIGEFKIGYNFTLEVNKDPPNFNMGNIWVNFPWWNKIDKIEIGRVSDPSCQFPGPGLLPTINYPYVGTPPSDLGIGVYGHLSEELSYRIAIVNGNGFSNWKDNNSNKDIAASLALSIPEYRLSGILDGVKLRTILKKGKQPNGDRISFGGDFSVTKWFLELRGGYVLKREEDENKDGGWILLLLDVGKFQPLIQLDGRKDRKCRLTVGTNFQINKHQKIRLNLEKIFGGSLGVTLQHQFSF